MDLELPRANRRNVGLTLAFLLVLVVVNLLVPHWSVRYGTALVVFTLWMAWFVVLGAKFIGIGREDVGR